jgi:hypothetical protein
MQPALLQHMHLHDGQQLLCTPLVSSCTLLIASARWLLVQAVDRAYSISNFSLSSSQRNDGIGYIGSALRLKEFGAKLAAGGLG